MGSSTNSFFNWLWPTEPSYNVLPKYEPVQDSQSHAAFFPLEYLRYYKRQLPAGQGESAYQPTSQPSPSTTSHSEKPIDVEMQTVDSVSGRSLEALDGTVITMEAGLGWHGLVLYYWWMLMLTVVVFCTLYWWLAV
ncbi:hypothetical protein ACLX1H_009456 [Fusarium chlamydosporum]